MHTVVPRWEWRTFASSFGAAERAILALPPGPIQESDELYLLSPTTDANVKVRGGLLDIKALERVDAHGLEQWLPVLKAGFPLPSDAVARVCAELGVERPQAREGLDLDSLRAELARRGVRAVAIHKRRHRYTIGGCTGELTELNADGVATRSVAIELEDPERVRAAVVATGLAGFENTSYPRGLKRLLGFPS
jgi:exopolyphosphatase/guanosine-5'-triphosphate,3'-diphosphate pyrophosphatase